jgi:hypothetical protein
MWETSKPPGPVIMIDQLEIGGHIYLAFLWQVVGFVVAFTNPC